MLKDKKVADPNFRRYYDEDIRAAEAPRLYYQAVVEKGCARSRSNIMSVVYGPSWTAFNGGSCHNRRVEEDEYFPRQGYPELERIGKVPGAHFVPRTDEVFDVDVRSWPINMPYRYKYVFGNDYGNPRLNGDMEKKIRWQLGMCTCNWDQCNRARSLKIMVPEMMILMMALIWMALI